LLTDAARNSLVQLYSAHHGCRCQPLCNSPNPPFSTFNPSFPTCNHPGLTSGRVSKWPWRSLTWRMC